MPLDGPLVDRYGRIHDDLRISVTDRCNLRCVYCMPEEGMTFLPRKELLSYDEIIRVARVAHDLGVSALRLTGGEPLVRKDLALLVAGLSGLGFQDLAVTTNAMLLAAAASPLAEAGLKRVNVSIDSLRADRFESIRRRGNLATVLHAMDVAEEVGLRPIKINVVLLRGRNDDEILDFATFARDTGRVVRFIEFMPLDAQGQWDRSQLVPGQEVFERISEVFALEAIGESGPAPAERFRFADGRGEIGLIAPVSQPFCGHCSRIRLTADGKLRTCLFSKEDHDLRYLLRGGANDREIGDEIQRIVEHKEKGHRINEPGFVPPSRTMVYIGG
jgi:cyclic pyranopterin phosphate synthase